jgi:NAD(P)H-dependent FMN reductase
LAGEFGGVRAATLIQPFLGDFGVVVLPTKPFLTTVHTKLDDKDGVKDEKFQNMVQKMTKELVWYTAAIREHKQTSGSIN